MFKRTLIAASLTVAALASAQAMAVTGGGEGLRGVEHLVLIRLDHAACLHLREHRVGDGGGVVVAAHVADHAGQVPGVGVAGDREQVVGGGGLVAARPLRGRGDADRLWRRACQRCRAGDAHGAIARRHGPLSGSGPAPPAVLFDPAPRHDPACVPHHRNTSLRRRPGSGSLHQVGQGFSTTRCVMGEVGHPGIDGLARDVCPGLAVPGAEIGFQQGVIDPVAPPQATQVPPHRPATHQRRRADDTGQTVPVRMAVDAPRQATGRRFSAGSESGRISQP